MAKTLVIYYSRTGENYVSGNIISLKKGNTEIVAETICDAVDADLFQIETIKEYAKNYTACTEEAKKELHNNEYPELKSYIDSIENYENIVVAGPCWWGTYPMAVFSQLKRLDFSGKNVYAVMTHEGSGLGSAEADLKKYCVGASLGKGLAIHGSHVLNSQNTIIEWAKKFLE